MSRVEENKEMIKEINKLMESPELITMESENMRNYYLSVISAVLIDISTSMAVIADNNKSYWQATKEAAERI